MVLPLLGGCAGVKFTFSGANLSPKVKTFSVDTFANEAADGPANLGLSFTESLKTYLLKNTNLEMAPDGTKGDIEYSGFVQSYTIAPIAAGAGSAQLAEQQRMTVSVKVNFVNNYEDENSFDQAFSFYYDFPATQTPQSVEPVALDVIFEQVNYDIFSKSIANW